MPFVLGRSYTRIQISASLGGDRVTFLPHAGGKVVCVALDPAKNPRGPEIVPVGPGGTTRLRWAAVLSKQGGAVPLFVKLGRNFWEYRGKHRCTQYVTKLSAVRHMADPDGRQAARAILRLAPVSGSDLPGVDDPILAGKEGSLRLRMHFARERRPELARAKRAEAVRLGVFHCEACHLDFRTLGRMGAARCEVHHLRPLADLGRGESMLSRLDDLALLCANCHRMIHAAQPMLSPRALHRMLKG